MESARVGVLRGRPARGVRCGLEQAAWPTEASRCAVAAAPIGNRSLGRQAERSRDRELRGSVQSTTGQAEDTVAASTRSRRARAAMICCSLRLHSAGSSSTCTTGRATSTAPPVVPSSWALPRRFADASEGGSVEEPASQGWYADSSARRTHPHRWRSTQGPTLHAGASRQTQERRVAAQVGSTVLATRLITGEVRVVEVHCLLASQRGTHNGGGT